jgi:hypothetical protein
LYHRSSPATRFPAVAGYFVASLLQMKPVLADIGSASTEETARRTLCRPTGPYWRQLSALGKAQTQMTHHWRAVSSQAGSIFHAQ